MDTPQRRKDDRYYVRLDIGFFDHPKAVAAGADGRALWLVALVWSRGQLTDGDVPAAMLPLLAFKAGLTVDSAQAAADRCVEVGLLERTAGGWSIHDYGAHQTTRDEIDGIRQAWRERQARRRKAAQTTPETGHQDVTCDNDVSHGGVTRPETESETETETENKRSQSVSGPFTAGLGYPQAELLDSALELVADTLAARYTTGEIAHRRYRAAILADPAEHIAGLLEAGGEAAYSPAELAAAYLARREHPTAARSARCGVCGGAAHPSGPIDCPQLTP